MKCSNCGTDNPEGSRFCMSCAAPLAPAAPAAPIFPGVTSVPAPAPPARHRQPHEDILGLMSLAFVLIGLATVFALNANLLTDLREWLHLVSTRSTIFVRPPEGVIVSAAWFFGVVGGLEFVSAILRWGLRWTPLRVLGRVLSGVGDVVLAELLVLYSARTIPGAFLLAVLAGTVGVLLLVYVTLGIYWASARVAPRPEAVQPPARQ